MNNAVKKILLTGSALVAVSFAAAGIAQAQTVTADNTPIITSGGGVHFGGNFTTHNNATDVLINGDITTAGGGTLNFTGGNANSVTGTVAAVTLGVSGGAAVAFGNTTFNASAINFGTDGGTLNLNAPISTTGAAINFGANAGIVNIAAGSTYTGTAQGTNAGTITFNGASTATMAALGTSGNALAAVNISGGLTGGLDNQIFATNVNLTGAGATTFSGITGNLNLNHLNAHATFKTGTKITGNVATATPGEGMLIFSGVGSVDGTVTNLGTLQVNGAGGQNVTLTGAATMTNLNITSNAGVIFGAGGSISGPVSTTTTGTIRNDSGTLAFTNGITANAATLDLQGTAGYSFGTPSTVSAITKDDAGTSVIAGAGSVAATTTTISGGAGLDFQTSGKSNVGNLTIGAGGGTVSATTGASGLLATSITGNAGSGNTATVSAAVGVGADADPTVTVSSGTLNVTAANSVIGLSTVAAGSVLNFAGAGTSAGISGAGTFGLTGTDVTLGGNVTTTSATVIGGVNASGAGAYNVTNLTKTAADANIATIANNVTATNVNVENGTLNLNGTNSVTNVNMGVAASGNVSVLNGAIGTVTGLNHLGGNSTVTNAIIATDTTIKGGGTMTVSNAGSNIGTLTFHTTGGTLAGAGGASLSSIVGHSDLSGTGTVNSELNNKSVTNSSTHNGIIHVANGSSNLANVSAVTGSTVRFSGTQITGTTTGAGTVELAGGAQQVNTLGTATNDRLGTVILSAGTKTLNGNAFVGTMDVVGNTVTTGAGAIDVTTLNKLNTDTDAAMIGNNLTAATINLRNGTLTLNGAANDITTLNLGEGGQSRVVALNGTGPLGTIANINHNGTGTSAIAGAVTATNVAVAGGALTFSNATTAITNVSFSGAGTLNLNNVTGARSETITFGGFDGTVNYGAGVTYSGAATTAGGDLGNLNFGNGATIDAAATIGSAGNKLKSVTFAGGTNATNAAIHADIVNVGAGGLSSYNTTFHADIHFAADSTVTLAAGTAHVGTNGVAGSGDITTASAGTGALAFSGGPLTINGNLAQLRTLNLTDNLTVTGNATAANAMNIAAHTMTVGGTFNTTSSSQLNFFVTPAPNPANPPVTGSITATGVATVAAGTRVNMTVDTGVYVPDNQEYVLVSGAAGSSVANISAGLTTTNTALLHFKQRTGITDRLVVYADRTQMNNAAKLPNNAAVGTMLDALGAGGDKDVTDLQVRLANFMSATEVEAMLATLVPDVSGSAVNAVTSVAGSASTVVNNRVSGLRAGESYGSGMASGNWAEGGHFWGQVFGSRADQDRRDNIAGYDSESYGTVFGVDTEVADAIHAGLAFAYANTEVDGEDANRTQTDLDSYQVALYGSYDLPDNYFLTGQLSYMYSDIDTTRYNVGGLAGNTARADFSSNQYSISTEVGRDYRVDGTIISLTPSGTFNYTYVDLEDYTERGAGGLSLRNVDTDEVQILEFGANLRAEARFEDRAGGEIVPNLHAGYRYDVIGDKVATTGRLAGGGAAFKSEGFEPSQHTVNAGAGIKWTTASDFEFTVNYDYEHKSDYADHSGFVRAGYKF